MEGRIINKSIIPDKFEIYEKDVNSSSIVFVVKKENDGLDFTQLDGYAHVEFESGRVDRAKLLKEVRQTDVAFTLKITANVSCEEGSHRIQLSFENQDLEIVYNTSIFTFEVKESIDGNLAYETLPPSILNDIEQNFNGILNECKEVKTSTEKLLEDAGEIKEEVEDLKVKADEIAQTTIDYFESVEVAKTEVIDAKSVVQGYVSQAQESKNLASQSAINAEESKDLAQNYASQTETNKNLASQSATSVETNKNLAQSYASQAETSKNLAQNYASQAESDKNVAEQAKNEVIDIVMHMEDYAVTSVNGKTGYVELTPSDIGALPDTCEIPTELKNPYPLIVDGVSYDGSSEVEVVINKICNVYNEEQTTIYVDESTVNVCTGVSKLRILKGNISVSKASVAEIYFTALDDFAFSSESGFYYYGDSCLDGNFMPKKGHFKFSLYSVLNGNNIYVEVKEITAKQVEYSALKDLPTKVYSQSEGHTYGLSLYGNLKTQTVNGVTSPVFPCQGVGDTYDDFDALTNSAVTVTAQNENYFNCLWFFESFSDVDIGYNEEEFHIWFQGEVTEGHELTIPLGKVLESGSTYTLWAFKKPGVVENLPTSGLIMELGLLNSSNEQVAKIGLDYELNACEISGFSHTVTASKDITSVSVKILENAMGVMFDPFNLGVMITGGTVPTTYLTPIIKEYKIYYDNQLLGFNNNYDEISLNNGKLYRRLKEFTITSKSQLKAYDSTANAQAVLRNNGNIIPIPAYNRSGIIWVEGKTLEESKLAVTPYSGGFKLNPEIYGTYANFNESMLPIKFVYVKMNPTVEDIKTRCAIKLFEGNTSISVESSLPCSKARIKTIVK